MRADRLLKLADFLDALPTDKFYFGSYVEKQVNDCGTVCCALGWCPVVFPDDWEWREGIFQLLPFLKADSFREAPWQDAMLYFGIDGLQSAHLFNPHGQYPEQYGGIRLGDDATPAQVASNIREFVRRSNEP